MGGVLDSISDVFNDAVDLVSDSIDFVVDTTIAVSELDFEGVWDAQKDFIEDSNDYFHDLQDQGISLVDAVFDSVGITGTMDFLYNMNEGSRIISQGVIDGKKDAWITAGMMALSIVLAIPSGGTSLVWTYLQIASFAYTIYGIAMTVAEIGAMAINGKISNLFNMLSKMRDAMALAFTNAWINGSMGMWMAGGVLYDSPRAGDVLFTPDGELHTTRFLSIKGKNNTNWSAWQQGKFHDFNSKIFGNMAGDVFFSVAPLSQKV